MESLRQLHAESWLTFDELDVINVINVRRKAKPLHISKDKMKRTKPLFIEFYLGEVIRDNRSLLPIANRVFSIIGVNVQYFITREMGIYFDNESVKYQKNSIMYRLKFRTYPELDFSDQELSDTVSYVIKQLYEGDAFGRLCTELQSIPPLKEYWIGPAINWVYESSLQVVGAKGWKRMATEKNVSDLLDATHVKARFGNRRINLR